MTLIRTTLVLLMLAVATPAVADPPLRADMEEVLRREGEILERAKAHDPALYDDLVRLREGIDGDPRMRREYIRTLTRVNGELRRAERDPEIAERDREMRERRRQIEELAAGWRDLSEREQKARRKEMETLAGELFDLRQAERLQRLEEMEARLKEMREEIEAREAERDQVIERHLDELIYGPADL